MPTEPSPTTSEARSPRWRALARPGAVALAVATTAVFAAGFAPLFDGPGYEISLAAGLIAPVCAAVGAALELSAKVAAGRASPDKRAGAQEAADRAEGSSGGSAPPVAPAAPPQPFDMLGRGLALGAMIGAAAYLTTLVHGVRTGFCDPWTGTQNFLLGPFIGAMMGGAWGALAGEIAGRRARPRARRVAAALLAIAGPLAGVVVSVGRFLSSPMVFAYDPFAGYFSGTLYDTVIDASGLITYRAGSAATLGAAVVLALSLTRDDRGGLALRRPVRVGAALAGALCALASAAHLLSGASLGHYQTAATIAEALGARAEGLRCTVLYPRGAPAPDIERFTRDCDAHVRDVEAWFEAKGPDRITVYLFGNVGQKAALMGAADTQIAKPWRREVYVQMTPYPHPVIGHELAHVIAGQFARGPFLTGGGVAGLLPNPGLIEGVAVAASPREGDLTAAEWARAMKDLGILPRLGDLFALGFLGANSGVAYTVSGAFVGYVKEWYGAAAVRDWYGGEPLPEVTGASWAELERRFHAALDALPLTDAAKAQARARFDRPGIFGRRCPHVVDLCNRKAEAMRAGGDEDGALEQYAIIRRLDPGDMMVRVGMARARLQKGEVDEARRELRAIVEDERAPRHVRDRALEDLADMELGPGGDAAFAVAAYRELSTRTVDEDVLRTLGVKAYAAETPRARAAVFQYLVGDPGRGPERVRAAELFGAWAQEAPDDGLPDYLMARYLQGAGLYAEARPRLAAASSKKLPGRRVEVETLRLQIINACALGDPVAAQTLYDAYRAQPEVAGARRDAMASLVGRCAQDRGKAAGQ